MEYLLDFCHDKIAHKSYLKEKDLTNQCKVLRIFITKLSLVVQRTSTA
ncbi:MAG: hypothetical protein RL711_1005 [Bacteroidota bacterium]|jgi:hypothetical protein